MYQGCSNRFCKIAELCRCNILKKKKKVLGRYESISLQEVSKVRITHLPGCTVIRSDQHTLDNQVVNYQSWALESPLALLRY